MAGTPPIQCSKFKKQQHEDAKEVIYLEAAQTPPAARRVLTPKVERRAVVKRDGSNIGYNAEIISVGCSPSADAREGSQARQKQAQRSCVCVDWPPTELQVCHCLGEKLHCELCSSSSFDTYSAPKGDCVQFEISNRKRLISEHEEQGNALNRRGPRPSIKPSRGFTVGTVSPPQETVGARLLSARPLSPVSAFCFM